MQWDSSHYLKYRDERTRPARDLISRIELDSPRTIVDLGCGPGNSTQVLRQRWPEARITGVDSSAAMLDAARTAYPRENWVLGDAAQWSTSPPVDLVFSNAALQWIPDHRALMHHLLAQVAAGGALAFQIPSATYSPVRLHIQEVAQDPAWSERMSLPRAALTMHDPSFYYDCLVAHVSRIELWETEYCHILASQSAIVDWMASTGLRPFLELLDEDAERQRFLRALHDRVEASYSTRIDGKVLFPFRRLFVIAYR